MVDIKSNSEGLGVHQNEEMLQNAHMKTKTEEKSYNSETYGFEPQTGVMSEPMIELKTPKVESNISEQVGGNSSLGNKIQEDLQENPLRNAMQEKSSEDNESTYNHYQE